MEREKTSGAFHKEKISIISFCNAQNHFLREDEAEEKLP